MALNSCLYFRADIGSKKFFKSVRIVSVADNLQQNSIDIFILPKVIPDMLHKVGCGERVKLSFLNMQIFHH